MDDLGFIVHDTIQNPVPLWRLYAIVAAGAVILNIPLTFAVQAVFYYRYKQKRHYGKLYFQCYFGAFILMVLVG
jgi:hypothetical protein